MNIVEITVRRGWPAAPFFAEIGLESTRPLSSLSDDNTSSPDTKMELSPRQKVLILAVRRNEKVVLVWEASFSRPGPSDDDDEFTSSSSDALAAGV